MLETLRLTGIENVHLDLGHVGIFRGLTRGAGLSAAQEADLFDVLQRKALTPSDFPTAAAAAARILGFQHHYQTVARPFEWRFTRRDLARLLARCSPSSPARIAA